MPKTARLGALDRSVKSLPLKKMARSSGFMRRKPRKIGPRLFLKAICLMALSPGASLSLAAALISLAGPKAVSRQGLWKRLGAASAAFVAEAARALMAAKSGAQTMIRAGVFASFRRVLVEDSTVLPLGASLAKAYPGGANQHGKKRAAAKVNAVYDLLQGAFVRFGLSPFTRNDQAGAPDILQMAGKGDLLLRDLGFFALPVFARLMEAGAFFVRRLRHGLWIADLDGNRLDLLRHLRRHGAFDAQVLLGKKEKLRVRLVAVRISKAAAAERRRRLRQNRDKRLHPTKEQLALLDWTLILTNVKADLWDAQTLCNVYRLRWRIEIWFKAWKSHLRMADLPNGSRGYVETLIWARLLLAVLLSALFTEIFWRADERPKRLPSLLKTTRFALLCLTHAWMPRLDLSCARLERILQRLCAYDQRQDRQCFSEFLHKLG